MSLLEQHLYCALHDCFYRIECCACVLQKKLLIECQTKGEECHKCGWAMKFPDESCRCELESHIHELRELLRWYVDNDDTNDEPSNAYYLNGKIRAMNLLKVYEDK